MTEYNLAKKSPQHKPRTGVAFGAGLLFSGTTLQKQNRLTNPRGLRADDAAVYLGMGKTKFLELVGKGMIPRAFEIDGKKIWDRLDLDAVIDAAKQDTPSENNSFDKIMRR